MVAPIPMVAVTGSAMTASKALTSQSKWNHLLVLRICVGGAKPLEPPNSFDIRGTGIADDPSVVPEDPLDHHLRVPNEQELVFGCGVSCKQPHIALVAQ